MGRFYWRAAKKAACGSSCVAVSIGLYNWNRRRIILEIVMQRKIVVLSSLDEVRDP